MDAVMVHGFVQMWEKNSGMSKSKEAFIETVPGRKKDKLVIYFNAEKMRTFQLTDNIKSVVLRSREDDQNHLHLTFQNNNFLFIERLSSSDAQELKLYLDRVHQKKLEPSMRAHKDKPISISKATQQEISESSTCNIAKNSKSGSRETAKGSVSPVHQKIPKKSVLNCKKLLEDQHGKRKRMLSDSEINENKSLTKDPTRKKKSDRNILKCISHSLKLKENKKLVLNSSFMTESSENPCLKGSEILQTLTEEMFLAFMLKQKYSEYFPEWDKLGISFDFHPEKIWQGLPNLGNTCYMNAVLQTLFSIPSFADDLLNQRFPWGGIPVDGLSTCLAQLLILKGIYNVKVKEKLLVNVKNAISAVAEIFSGDTQNDAHEFLGHCLQQVKENVVNLNTMWMNKNESEEENSSQDEFASSSASKMPACPVITNFELELLCSIICKGCGQFVIKMEPSNYLSINLPQGKKMFPVSIQSTLNNFFSAEELEYKCGKCQHKRSVAFHKFNRLPRVLIIHLKRYSFNDYWSIRKDDQEVIISKYLKLSAHCNLNTKPPFPLSKNTHPRELQILKIFQTVNSGIISSPPSKNSASDLKKSLDLPVASYDESNKFQRIFKGSKKGKKQNDLGKDSKLNTVEAEFVNPGDKTLREKQPLAGSVRHLGDTSLSLNRKGRGKHTTNPYTRLEALLQKLTENRKLQVYGKTSVPVELDSDGVTKTKDSYENKKHTIQEGSPKVANHIQKCAGVRIYKQASQQVPPQSLPKSKAQKQAENLTRSTEFSFQAVSANHVSALGSNTNPGNKGIFGEKKMDSKAQEPKINTDKANHTYRLIGVVSHLGSSPDSGHYISDAYDFERQAWFTYNDLHVQSIQEAPMLNSRACTGYVFFYMHNDIFEELLKREKNSQLPCTGARKTPQKK
ncbi:ubiquitin carboxyl-terminal hydrolase 26 [Oryctolagus cuniculus]|uniref:Ubiquitin carboxyl-terminal hydrolase n=1 Tax=Oryctolagus cuniculus TaxID=9986 RepID=G1TJ09_RABIT|nr:ubiquitin carboxyl-terminal hydrolase 26 [Oryctolagus cuniculus]